MLDKPKLMAQISHLADEILHNNHEYDSKALDLWCQLINDQHFLAYALAVHDAEYPVPVWHEDIKTVKSISCYAGAHVVVSVDGSQIYPDRHALCSCSLINIGSIVLFYGLSERTLLSSTPTVFLQADDERKPYSVDTVNGVRQEFELKEGLSLGVKYTQKYQASVPALLLFDGALLFWHLLSKENQVRDALLARYNNLLLQLYNERVLCAWYISLAKSKELVTLVRLYAQYTQQLKDELSCVDSVTDAAIMAQFLKPYTRSAVFKSQSPISFYYPGDVAPFFFYVHTGYEVGRVEIPAWIARDTALLDMVAAIIMDQCRKGYGYPMALAEAHEQAVVKGADRDFFYHVLQKLYIERKAKVTVSQKSLKKKIVGV